MSFCLEIKEDLSKINTYSNSKLLLLELIGNVVSNSEIKDNKYLFSSEYFVVIKRIYSILNKLYNYNEFEKIKEKKNKTYELEFAKEKINITLEDDMDLKEIGAIFRGAFLLGGTITSPDKEYHLDIIVDDLENAEKLCNLALYADIEFKILQRKKKYAIYLKDAEKISDFLVLIGAEAQMLKLEEARVLKDVRNNVNRTVNCETANLNKTLEASLKVIDDIKYIKSKRKFETLDDGLKEIATLRMKNPNASLQELALLCSITKSGVKHRLEKISKIAKELKK